jgi:hypothetical protein
LKVNTGQINELKVEIIDGLKTIEELHSKVDEYEVIIDCMEKEYEWKCNEQHTKISSLEVYYQEVIAEKSLRYVMKKWVKNKMQGKSMLLMYIIFVSHILC